MQSQPLHLHITNPIYHRVFLKLSDPQPQCSTCREAYEGKLPAIEGGCIQHEGQIHGEGQTHLAILLSNFQGAMVRIPILACVSLEEVDT